MTHPRLTAMIDGYTRLAQDLPTLESDDLAAIDVLIFSLTNLKRMLAEQQVEDRQ